MESLKLTPNEQTFYGELFQTCDVDGGGKISGMKATELFLSSGLSYDILSQISELCGAKRLGHFGRSQFYIALKLIAAVQCGMPAKLDSINSGMDAPLPKFQRVNDQDKRVAIQNLLPSQEPSDRASQPVPVQPPQQALGQLPPPPVTKKSHGRTASGQFRGLVDRDAAAAAAAATTNVSVIVPQPQSAPQVQNQEESPNNAISPNQFSPTQSPPSSPPIMIPQTSAVQPAANIPSSTMATANQSNVQNSVSSPVSKSIPNQMQATAAVNHSNFQTGEPTVIKANAPTTIHTGPPGTLNSTLDSYWTSFEDEESHGLLGTGPKKTYHLEPPAFDSSSISSDQESVDDIWCINEEQRDYYVQQFQSMQPDLSGAILGNVAKEFFEKSKLPVHELSKIWQLSDLNRDGALSLEEFCIAMHLVVLRRNEIELPDRLPLSLMPYSAFSNEEPFAADLPPGSTLKRLTPPASPQSQQQQASQWAEPVIQEVSSDTASDVASPSLTPANFAFSRPNPSDPESGIVHPIAVRMSPESQMQSTKEVLPERGSKDTGGKEPASLIDTPNLDQLETPNTKQCSNTESVPDASQNDIDLLTGDLPLDSQSNPQAPLALQIRPRPVPAKKTVPGTVSGLLVPVPASSQNSDVVGTTERQPLNQSLSQDQEPPLPPPRPTQGTQGRSLSVDLIGLQTPPAVPPRTSPKDSPAIRKTTNGFGAIDSEKIAKFADFKKFESIPSEESLVISKMSSSTDPPSETVEAHRRSLSLDYSKMSQQHSSSVPEVADAVDGGTTARVASPTVMFDVPEDVDSGTGEKQKVPISALRQISRDKKDLQMAIRTHKERNSMLERLGSELNQELQEVMEQRIALEIQLEHLKPFSS